MSLGGIVELLIADPPYNIRQQVGWPDSNCDVFTNQDIADVLDPSEVSLKHDGQDYVFCSF